MHGQLSLDLGMHCLINSQQVNNTMGTARYAQEKGAFGKQSHNSASVMCIFWVIILRTHSLATGLYTITQVIS